MMYRLLLWLRDPTNQQWVKPAIGSLLAIVFALMAAWGNTLLPPDFLPPIEAETLNSLLGVIASSMLAVSIFSLSIMVSAFATAASAATPRASELVVGDRSAHAAIASFLSAFIFAIIAKTALGLGYYGVNGRFLLFLCTLFVLGYLVVALIRWVKTLSSLGRMGNTLGKIEDAAERAMRTHRSEPYMGAGPGGPPPEGAIAVLADRVGTLRHIDLQALQDWADAAPGVLHLQVRPGALVHPGTVLLAAACPMAPDAKKLRQAFVLGPARSFDQDPRFGLIVLSEVAQRALSPAVNDPGTAIAVMNTLTRVLVDVQAEPDAGDADRADAKLRYPRLTLPPLHDADFIDHSFGPIARDGAATLEISLRMLKLLRAVAQHCPAPLAQAARAQALTMLHWADKSLVLDSERAQVRALYTQLYGAPPVAADAHAGDNPPHQTQEAGP